MGFPIYTDLFLPKLLLYTLTILGFIRKFVSGVFRTVGMGDFLEPSSEMSWPTSSTQVEYGPEFHSVSAVLIRELLPVAKYSDHVGGTNCPALESCAVCLYEFDGSDEIRPLMNCRHVFHRGCLDRWMDHDQKTCPLCRTPFIPDDLMDAFNERLWAASGITDYYGDYDSPINGL